MPRGKRKPKQETSKLLQAMQFLSVCQKDEADNDAGMYCMLQNNTAVAFNGILAAGIKIDEDLNACPHTHQMALALSRCGTMMQITQLSPEMLQVRSEGFEAFIPCCKREKLTAVNPEAGNIPVSHALTSALEIAAPLASDKADILEAASIQLNSNSVLATNREMVLEAWHGSNIPFSGFLIPKIAAVALAKTGKNVVSVGIKPNIAALFPAGENENLHDAMTFWFEDRSWLRTNLYKGKWRDIPANMLKLPSDSIREIPSSFFETVAKIMPFSDDDKVYCSEGKISSHYYNQKGAGYSLPVTDGPINKIYKGKNLLIAGKYCNNIDENSSKNATMFFGDKVRCAVWHDEYTPNLENDEEIPF